MTSLIDRNVVTAKDRLRQSRLRHILLAAAGFGFIAVVSMWGFDLRDSTTTPGAEASKLTGLLAAYAMAIALVLMAGVPTIERAFGADTVRRWHIRLAACAVALAGAHLVLFGIAHEPNQRGGARDLAMTLAGVSLVVIAGVAVTSVLFIRKRMSFEAWRGVHLLTYAAFTASTIHQLTRGSQFVNHPIRQWIWGLGFFTIACTAIYYRFVRPSVLSRRHHFRVSRVVRESPDVVSVYFDGDRLADLALQAGQFLRWRFDVPHMRKQLNPYSLSADPASRGLRITVKRVGDNSHSLGTLEPGTRVYAEGPHGALTLTQAHLADTLLVAGGIGISPICALAQASVESGGHATIIYCASHVEDVVLRDDLNELTNTGVSVHYVVGTPNVIKTAFARENLRSLVPNLGSCDVFVCGSEGFAKTVVTGLTACDVPRTQIHTESFG